MNQLYTSGVVTEHSEACASSSVGEFGSAFSKLIIETLTEAVIVVEDNMPGPSLDGQDPSQLHVVELKPWLKYRGTNQSGRKGDLVKQLVSGAIAYYSHIFIAKTYMKSKSHRYVPLLSQHCMK